MGTIHIKNLSGQPIKIRIKREGSKDDLIYRGDSYTNPHIPVLFDHKGLITKTTLTIEANTDRGYTVGMYPIKEEDIEANKKGELSEDETLRRALNNQQKGGKNDLKTNREGH